MDENRHAERWRQTSVSGKCDAGAVLPLSFGVLMWLSFIMFCQPVQAESKAPLAVAGADKVYLFSYFVRNGEDGLHLAWSEDGFDWKVLKDGGSFLTPRVGESKLMRDPSLLLAADGTFHMVWTTAWKGKTIGYARSRDLIRWSEQKAIPVMAHEPNADNCWAPDLFFDKGSGQYIIVWATTLLTPGLPPPREGDHRLYCTTTRDFETYTPVRLFFDPGYSVIDGTLLQFGESYRLVFKDERLGPPIHKYLQIAASTNAVGPWEKAAPPFTSNWVEGPTSLRIGKDILIYFDCYRDGRYGAMKSKDLEHWEDMTSRLSMPKGMRHGTALTVPRRFIEHLILTDGASTNAPASGR